MFPSFGRFFASSIKCGGTCVPARTLASKSFAQSSNKCSALNIIPRNNFHSSKFLKSDHADSKAFAVVKQVEFPVDDVAYYKSPASELSSKVFSYFVIGTASAGYATAVKNGVFDLLATMAPSADVLALANIEVDLGTIPEGSTVTVKWRGKPLFIRHRTQAEIETAVATPLDELKDMEKDEQRAKKPEWLVVLGICTHLGCVPLSNQGDYNGWFCPCHGSHYDLSGRIRKGPAPKNLEVPPYSFMSDDKILVGSE